MGGRGASSGRAGGNSVNIQFTQGNQQVRITRFVIDKDGANSVKAQSRGLGQDWKDITDSNRLRGLRSRADAMKKYDKTSTADLQSRMKTLESNRNSSYDSMTKVASSKTGILVSKIADMDTEIAVIKSVLQNRKYNQKK